MLQGEDPERAERIIKVLESMREANKIAPVIVEGRRDVLALRQIGFSGEILTLHSGKGIYEFCNETAEHFDRVILLMDWDDKGEFLQRTVSEHLKGHWEEFSMFRDIIKILCQKDIKDIESMPKLLKRLSGEKVAISDD